MATTQPLWDGLGLFDTLTHSPTPHLLPAVGLAGLMFEWERSSKEPLTPETPGKGMGSVQSRVPRTQAIRQQPSPATRDPSAPVFTGTLAPQAAVPLLHPTADQVPDHSHPVCPLTASRGCTKDRLHPPLGKRLPGDHGCLSREGRVFLSGCTSPKTQAPSRSMVKPPQGCGQPGTRPRPPTRWTQGLDRAVRGLRRRRRVAHS